MVIENLTILIEDVFNDLENTLFRTLGPGGGNILIHKNNNTAFTKDGISILNAINYTNDPTKQAILNIIREASQSTFSEAGDGTTSTAVLIRGFYKYFINEHTNASIQDIKELQNELLEQFESNLSVYPLDDESILEEISLSASNNNKELSDIVIKAINMQGEIGSPSIVKSDYKLKTDLVQYEGFVMDKGYLSAAFINETKSLKYIRNKSGYVLLISERVNKFNDVISFYQIAKEDNKDLYIVAKDFNPTILENFIQNCKLNSESHIIPIIITGIGEESTKILEDLAVYLDTEVLPIDRLRDYKGKLGEVSNVEISQFNTILKTDLDTTKKVQERIDALKDSKLNRSPMIVKQLNKRIQQLSGKDVIIEVGGETPSQTQENFDILDDTLKSVVNTIESGWVKGIGSSYIENKGVPSIVQNLYAAVLCGNCNKSYENLLINSNNKDSFKTIKTAYKNALSASVALFNVKGGVIDAV